MATVNTAEPVPTIKISFPPLTMTKSWVFPLESEEEPVQFAATVYLPVTVCFGIGKPLKLPDSVYDHPPIPSNLTKATVANGPTPGTVPVKTEPYAPRTVRLEHGCMACAGRATATVSRPERASSWIVVLIRFIP